MIINQNNTLSFKEQMRHEIGGRPLCCRCSGRTQEHRGDQLDQGWVTRSTHDSQLITLQDGLLIVGHMVIYRLSSLRHSEYQWKRYVRNTVVQNKTADHRTQYAWALN